MRVGVGRGSLCPALNLELERGSCCCREVTFTSTKGFSPNPAQCGAQVCVGWGACSYASCPKLGIPG